MDTKQTFKAWWACNLPMYNTEKELAQAAFEAGNLAQLKFQEAIKDKVWCRCGDEVLEPKCDTCLMIDELPLDSDMSRMIDRAISTERERCAKICESFVQTAYRGISEVIRNEERCKLATAIRNQDAEGG